MKNWYTLDADENRIMTKHFTAGRGGAKIDKVIIHYNYGDLSIPGVYEVWQTRRASAHYQVDRHGRIGQLVWDRDTAWHSGNWRANRTSIGVEHANGSRGNLTGPLTEACLDNGAHLVAALCKFYGLGRPEWKKNVFPHQAFSSTSCPGPLVASQHAAYVARMQYWYDQMTGAVAPKPPAVTPAPKPAPAPAAGVTMANYVRPVKDYTRHPISAAYRKPGSWAAGHHTGVDIKCPTGTPVYATIGGDVRTRARGGSGFYGSAYGTLVVINDDADGSDWMYCHLSKVVVSEGQKVKTGQLIGYSGTTGRSTGPHLHLERRPRYGKYGTDKNPNLWQ